MEFVTTAPVVGIGLPETTGTVVRLSTPAVVIVGAVVPPGEVVVVTDGMPVPVGIADTDVLVYNVLVDPWLVEVPVMVVPVVEVPVIEVPVVEVPICEVPVVDAPVTLVPVWEIPVEEVTLTVVEPPVVVSVVELGIWTVSQ